MVGGARIDLEPPAKIVEPELTGQFFLKIPFQEIEQDE